MAIDIALNEDTATKARAAAKAYHEKFSTQRKEWEDIWELADYFVKCAQNRTLNKTEMTKGFNPAWGTDAERAQTGSTIFFRQHRQLAAQIASVALSRDLPWKYSPVINEGVFMSGEDADEQAHQWNSLAKWTLKMDGFKLKIINFAHQIQKYGNIPVLFYQRRKIQNRTITHPEYTPVQSPEGDVEMVMTGTRDEQVDVLVENFPSMKVLPIDGLFADVLIGNLQDQECVLMPSLKSRHKMLEEVLSENWDPEQYALIDDTLKWDGSTNTSLKAAKAENQAFSKPSVATDQWLVWDIFMQCPIEGTDWNETDTPSQLYWITVVGNDIGKGVIVRFDRNEDPDDEIPVYMIHALPDDEDLLYHMAPAQVIRSNYSVECTLKNQMIDSNSRLNNPPLKEIEGEVRGTDRAYGPSTRFVCDKSDSISEFDVKDLSQSNIQFLEYIQTDTKASLSTEGNAIGEAYGGRTSALEAGNAYRNSMQPHMITVSYQLIQLFEVYAKKMQSYWEKYAYPGQIVAISDQEQFDPIYPAGLYGHFDVQVDIIDEYEDDVVQNQRIFDAMQLIGSNPEFSKNVDMNELLTEWFVRNKISPAKIVKRPFDYDAREVATKENAAMIQVGAPATVKPGENLTIHLAEHEGERLRFKGVEDQYPNVVLLDQHIEETKFALRQGPKSQGTPPAPSGNQGAGEIGGNAVAGALGAQVPQGA